MEGRYKYPPQLVGTAQFRYSHLDDPLVDVSSLALFYYLPTPEGIFNANCNVQMLFPTPSTVLDMYCHTRGYMRHLNRSLREDIFNVYLASHCLDRATLAIAELSAALKGNRGDVANEDLRKVAFAEQIARRGLELLMQRKGSKM